MLTLDEDRRSHPRIAVERPCKVYDPRCGKYYAATVHDLSGGGMLVGIDRGMNLQAGDVLYVGVAQKRRQMLLRTSEMLRTRVARAIGAPDGHWMIGLELVDQMPLAAPLSRRAA